MATEASSREVALGLAGDPVREVAPTALPVEGEVPAWLDGSLTRVVPAGLEVGGTRLEHWFDGLAMLDAFSFAGGEVTYASRWLDTAVKRAADEGRRPFLDFASDPCVGLFRRLFGAFMPGENVRNDNANVAISRIGDRHVALTETPMTVQFDPATLQTLGVIARPDDVGSAHPHAGAGGALCNAGFSFGPSSALKLYEMDDAGTRVLATVKERQPWYLHSFGLSERHAIVVGQPLRVDPIRIPLTGRFIDSFRWQPERGCRILVFDRASGALVMDETTEPFFVFHHINARDEGDAVVVDLCAYQDASIVDLFRLRTFTRGDVALPPVRPIRLRVTRGGVQRSELGDVSLELPTINYGAANERPYRFAYGISQEDEGVGAFSDSLVKLDVETGEWVRWREPGCVPGEPIFVRAPGGTAEDDGVVLSVVFDEAAACSFVVVLDGESFTERARAHAPQRIPLNFHGSFLRGSHLAV